MTNYKLTRRRLLKGTAALGAAAMLPNYVHASENIVATTYPGSFEEAYRKMLLAPFAKKNRDIADFDSASRR